jgi:hypothetical protein
MPCRRASSARVACARVRWASSAIFPTKSRLFTTELSPVPASFIKRPVRCQSQLSQDSRCYNPLADECKGPRREARTLSTLRLDGLALFGIAVVDRSLDVVIPQACGALPGMQVPVPRADRRSRELDVDVEGVGAKERALGAG